MYKQHSLRQSGVCGRHNLFITKSVCKLTQRTPTAQASHRWTCSLPMEVMACCSSWASTVPLWSRSYDAKVAFQPFRTCPSSLNSVKPMVPDLSVCGYSLSKTHSDLVGLLTKLLSLHCRIRAQRRSLCFQRPPLAMKVITPTLSMC